MQAVNWFRGCMHQATSAEVDADSEAIVFVVLGKYQLKNTRKYDRGGAAAALLCTLTFRKVFCATSVLSASNLPGAVSADGM